MKVSISLEGNVELDVSNGETQNAIEFIQKLQAENKKNQKVKEVEQQVRIEKTSELNGVQFDLWNYLCDHDCESGITIAAYARLVPDISLTAAGQRMAKLTNMGYAYRVGRGRYRARTP